MSEIKGIEAVESSKTFRSVPIRFWTNGVPIEPAAEAQLRNVAALPIIFNHIAVMPDVHWGIGATVGSVIPTRGAVIPAAVGVDIGCGMIAAKMSLRASELPENLSAVRSAIEAAVPHGRTNKGGLGDRGAWNDTPSEVIHSFGKHFGTASLYARLQTIIDKHPKLSRSATRAEYHLGTLGSGNHFIEICLDESDCVWIMLHSGSRGIGNAIGRYFIEKAKEYATEQGIHLPDKDLAWLAEDTAEFYDYISAVGWAQDFALENRKLMLLATRKAIEKALGLSISWDTLVVNCHHNYVARESHFGEHVWITRKGAVRAELGDYGIIPGSMGARSYIVQGLGNPDSFNSCSHGAGRAMSRSEAKRRFSLEDHIAATSGVECRKDSSVIDETPAAYKNIDAVIAAQSDLIRVVHTLKQVVCVKG